MKKVMTGGVFDLFHWGHVRYLATARKLGDHLTVVVNTDEFAGRYKRKPIMTLHERVKVLKSCIFVDEVIINHTDENWMPNIVKVKPNIIVTGTDWANRDYYKQMGVSRETLSDLGIVLCYIPYTQDISTTEIIKRVKQHETD